MTQQNNAKRVGLFVVIGFLIFFGIIFKFALANFLGKKDLFVLYFQESVKGLSVGSPVVLDGVEVGKVVQIQLITDKFDVDFQTPVYVRFNKLKETENHPTFTSLIERDNVFHAFLEKGLRGRLTTQNYLTGQLMVELVMLPEEKPIFRDEHSRYSHDIHEIPTVLSTIGELSKGLEKLPIQEMVSRSENILKTLEEELPILLPKMSALAESLTRTSDSINALTPHMQKTLQKGTQTLNNANQTMDDISASANSMRNLTDYLELHPESLLKGKDDK